MRRALLTLGLALLCAVVTAAQPPLPATLLVVDDLHLDFRMTPRTRELVGAAVRELLKSNVGIAIVSTSEHVPMTGPTADAKTLEGAVSQMVGQALKPSELLSGWQQEQVNAELDHHAQKAFTSTEHALASVAGATRGRKVDVIYFSAGYLSGVVSPPEELIASSLRLNAPVHTVDVFEILAVAGGQARLDASVHQLGPHESLVSLAQRTHGVSVLTSADFEQLLKAITSPAR